MIPAMYQSPLDSVMRITAHIRQPTWLLPMPLKQPDCELRITFPNRTSLPEVISQLTITTHTFFFFKLINRDKSRKNQNP